MEYLALCQIKAGQGRIVEYGAKINEDFLSISEIQELVEKGILFPCDNLEEIFERGWKIPQQAYVEYGKAITPKPPKLKTREELEREVSRLKAELSKIKQEASNSRWPWGNHETQSLRNLADAAHQWWSTYDPDEPQTAPTNAEVSGWLKQQGVSKRVAEVMAQILRDDDLPKGSRK